MCSGRDLQISQRGCWNTEMLGLDLTMGIPQQSHGLWMWQGSHWFSLATFVKSKLFETTADACPEDQGKAEHGFRTTTISYCRPASPMSFLSSQKFTASNCFCIIGSGTTPINLWNVYVVLSLQNLGILVTKILHQMEIYCQ